MFHQYAVNANGDVNAGGSQDVAAAVQQLRRGDQICVTFNRRGKVETIDLIG